MWCSHSPGLVCGCGVSSAGGLSVTDIESSRSVRYLGRVALNRVSGVKRCRECGRVTIGPGGLVGVRAIARLGGGITSGYAGLATCGRIWLCPVCNAKVMAYRAIEIGAVLSWAAASDREAFVIWGSLTCWHKSGDRLDDLIRIQREAWREVMQSKLWISWAASQGGNRLGYIRASEITVGVNGWHPHFHPIIIVTGSRAAASWFAAAIRKLWIEAVGRAGGYASDNDSQKLSVLDSFDAAVGVGGYVTKSQYSPQGLALEAVWSQSKSAPGRKPRVVGTLPHWSLLDAAGQGLAVEALSWWELEEATHGHRMITWSRGLRKLAGLGEEVADDVLAAKEIGSIEDTVCVITPTGWRRVREVRGLQAGILDTLEQSGWLALRDRLDLHGVEWSSLDEAAPGFAGVHHYA